ncbi:DUF1704 domain-containing protein [Candidatus Roizmanbacteria bacterium]|nr:DUF1704 domain-containing protein [Candidatus Roizmanbacteria bacterium]
MPTITTLQRKKLRRFSRQYLHVYNQTILSTSTITPINYYEEREKFFSSNDYNPQFRYRKIPLGTLEKQINGLKRQLASLAAPSELESYIYSLIDTLSAGLRAKEHIGTADFSAYIERVFPVRTSKLDDLITLAQHIRFAPTEKARLLSAHEMRDYFQNYIDQHPHLKHIRVRVDTVNDHTIRVGSKRLTIGAAVKRLETNVKRLIIHEIESHLIQRINIKQQKNPLLRLRTHYNRELYSEGMAVYNEIASGTITESAFLTYYLRAKAVAMREKSFAEMYEVLFPTMGAHKAFLTAYRVKRGMSDTGKPGGYPKDALYLLGYREVEQFINRGGRLEFLYLTQDPELGGLLLKYNLLPVQSFHLPKLF